jgi:hypothetical protein
MLSLIKKIVAAIMAAAAFSSAPAVGAPDPLAMPEYTVVTAPETGLPLRVKPGKPQVEYLTTDAARAVVDDKPAVLNVIMQGTRSFVLLPRSKSGAAHITIYDHAGKPLLARYVVINEPEKKYVRLRKTCTSGTSCATTHVYFCPNLCYQTTIASASASPG